MMIYESLMHWADTRMNRGEDNVCVSRAVIHKATQLFVNVITWNIFVSLSFPCVVPLPLIHLLINSLCSCHHFTVDVVWLIEITTGMISVTIAITSGAGQESGRSCHIMYYIQRVCSCV